MFQFSSVALLCPTACNPMDSVYHQFLNFTQTHVHWVGDAIQPSHPLSSPSPPTFSLSQHQGLFQWFSSSHQVTKILQFQLQHQTFQWSISYYINAIKPLVILQKIRHKFTTWLSNCTLQVYTQKDGKQVFKQKLLHEC